MKKILTCLLAILGMTTACGQQNFENADVQTFSRLTEDPDVVVLDVRTAEEFKDGHIEGAVLIDQGQSDFVERDSLQLHKKDYNEIAKNPLESNVTIGSLRPETSAAK